MKNDAKKQELTGALVLSIEDDSFVKLALGHYTGDEKDLKNILIRPVIIKREPKLSFTYRYKTRDIVKNYDGDEAFGLIGEALGAGFGAATLMTTGFDLVYDGMSLKKNPPSHKEAPAMEHDRQKDRPLDPGGKSWLHDLQITDASGRVLKNAQDKWRQINRYVEIVGGLIRDMRPEQVRKITDMGSGKGYLTFALYDYLRGLGLNAKVTGVEMRPDMVALCNKIAGKSNFSDLDFVQNTIAGYDATGTDILIALHACDTATDDAIARGIKAGAGLIVVAPCCHKQIRREIEAHQAPADLDFLMEYGIFRERQAEMVTDGLRALILNYYGYDTKVFEFISDAHTPKNVMIVGTKNPKAAMKNPAILKKIQDVKTYFGLDYHHLERNMQ